MFSFKMNNDLPLNGEENAVLQVAVALPVDNTFSYRARGPLASKAKVGCRIEIPFRNRKVTGYILERRPEDSTKELKDVLKVLDDEPLFHASIIPFFKWMAEYYLYQELCYNMRVGETI